MSVLLDRPRRARCGPVPSRTRLLTAVAALFAFDGAVFGSWAARIPDVTTQVGASHTALGLALLCVSIGALASMQLAGALCARLGAGLVASVSAVLICVAVTLPGLARTLPELGAALLAFGAATGAVNVAANSAGVRLEAAGDRPIMPGLHAAFSFGGLSGAAVGGVASGLGGVAPHLLAVGAVGLLLTAAIAPVLRRRGRRPGSVRRALRRAATRVDRTSPPARRTRPDRRLHGLRRGRDHRLGRPAPAGDPGGDPGRRCRRTTPRSRWPWPAGASRAAGSCGPSGRRTSSSSAPHSPRPACSPPPSPRSPQWRWSASRWSGWVWPTSSRSRSPARGLSAGRRGSLWPRPSVTPACSAARP